MHDETAEEARLEALKSYDILDTPPEAVFDEFARLAASIGGTPTALISLVDSNRQWFKARVGFDEHETSRNVAFCDHAIRGTGVFVVEDATQDPEFAHNPLVTGGPKIRFYAGAPLVTLDGHVLGTICMVDYVPREFSREQREALQALSLHVMAQLDLRRRLSKFAHGSAPRRKLLNDLRRAIDHDEFVLHYQPTYEVRTGHIESLEALIRWNNPERGQLAPKDFLPALEDSGMIVDAGIWVLNRAGNDYREWLDSGLAAPRITVNISPAQLRHPDFLAHLSHALDPDGHSRVPLDIEITEAAVADNSESTLGKLTEARRMGVQIAIDDFGTGYSSLRRLTHMPVDALKIDRSFITDMTETPEGMGLVWSIISLAHGLNLHVVAEGVATAEQRKLLQLLRCDRVQGYLFSMPVPKERMEDMLRKDQAATMAEWQDVVGDGPAAFATQQPVRTASAANDR